MKGHAGSRAGMGRCAELTAGQAGFANNVPCTGQPGNPHAYAG